ncbi:MAG: glycosyltransferase family 4 protein [Actinomycetota bacterium]
MISTLGRPTKDRDVLQVVTDSDRRGAQVFAWELEAALVKRGRSVETLAIRSSRDAVTLPIPSLANGGYKLRRLRRLRAAIQRSRVVVGHGSSTLQAVALCSVGTTVPFVFRTIGDPVYWSNTPARRLRTRVLLSRAAMVVALWPGSALALQHVLGVPAQKIRVIPRGVSAARFPPIDSAARNSARKQYDLPEDGSVAVYVGSLSQEKNVAAAILALREHQELRLVVVGSGPERSQLEELARAVASDRVLFTGVVSDPARVLAAADLLVLPSRSEGIPGVLIEAAMRGLPVVASDVGGVREVVRHGETGRLVEPDDQVGLNRAMGDVLESPDDFGKRGRQHCLSRFDIEDVATRWEQLLSEVGAWSDSSKP